MRPLHAHGEELAVVFARTHVIDIAAMPDHVAVAIRLRLVYVVHAVEAPVQIVLILSPRHAGHYLGDIALRLPLRHAVADTGIYAIAHRHVGADLNGRVPFRAGLKTGSLGGIGSNRRIGGRNTGMGGGKQTHSGGKCKSGETHTFLLVTKRTPSSAQGRIRQTSVFFLCPRLCVSNLG